MVTIVTHGLVYRSSSFYFVFLRKMFTNIVLKTQSKLIHKVEDGHHNLSTVSRVNSLSDPHIFDKMNPFVKSTVGHTFMKLVLNCDITFFEMPKACEMNMCGRYKKL